MRTSATQTLREAVHALFAALTGLGREGDTRHRPEQETDVQDLRRINVQPGDVFVVRYPVRQISQQDAAIVKARFRAALGPHTPVIVICKDVDLTVYRPVAPSQDTDGGEPV